MRLNKIKNISEFFEKVSQCSGDVYLKSEYGDVYNLKSEFSRYVALTALLGYRGDELELCCNEQDEKLFEHFLYQAE